MSTALAVAAVTRSLRALIGRALQEPLPASLPADVQPSAQMQVSTLPLDKVRTVNANGNLINLYLYSIVPNPAFRNGLPARGGNGHIGEAPLALSLHYLLTAFGQDDNELIAQLMLGRAMLALHDNALLMPPDLADALNDGGVHAQVERVRITPHTLGFEEMSKLWMAYQTQYRLSSAYEVSVVLIDSHRRPVRAPPVRSTSITVTPWQRPVIDQVTPAAAAAGASLTLTGANLGEPTTQVLVGGQRAVPDSRAERSLVFTLPASLPAGVNTVQVVQEVPLGRPARPHAGVGFQSNAVAFMLMPRITSAAPLTVARGAVLSLQVAPPVNLGQQVLLALDELQFAQRPLPPGAPASSGTVAFVVSADLVPRNYLARVMVDGAASALVIDSTPGSPSFNRAVGPLVTVT